MKSLSVLYTSDMSGYAFKELPNGQTPFEAACKNAAFFPNSEKLLIITPEADKLKIEKALESIQLGGSGGKDIEKKVIVFEKVFPSLIFKTAFKEIGGKGAVFFANADAPFIDLELTAGLYKQHLQYKAEYTFADGYPAGLLPEIVDAGLCGILAELTKDDMNTAPRNFIFEAVKKDINSFDLETMIAETDLRYLRLNFAANSKRNWLLCSRFTDITGKNYAELIKTRGAALRTLPMYYSIETVNKHPLKSIYKPPLKGQDVYIEKENFFQLIEKIASFSDDAVISLSIFGEPLIHPLAAQFIEKIISYPNLSVLIETCGLEVESSFIEQIAEAANAPIRKNGMLPLYWITCIDAVSSKMYGHIHNLQPEEAAAKLKYAVTTADTANKKLGKAAWVQIFRMLENEEELEPFYRFWKEQKAQIIIQKYSTLCKKLPDRRVADLSPLERHPCWHLKRDICILTEGTVPLCREDIECSMVLGNAFTDSLETIWSNSLIKYDEHLKSEFGGLCEFCDEYYTYNF